MFQQITSPFHGATTIIKGNFSACVSGPSVTRQKTTHYSRYDQLKKEIKSNALRRHKDPHWFGMFSLGVDMGTSCTGLALSKGLCFRPLTILKSCGQEFQDSLIKIAKEEEVDEFIIGLPKTLSGKENYLSDMVRRVSRRLAVRAAERGWRVYLQNEYGTSKEALEYMSNTGLMKDYRKGRQDAYAAAMILRRYYSMCGSGAELVLPKERQLQEKILSASAEVDTFT